MQKLRKSAGLKVDDKVTMCSVTPKDHNLDKTITKFSDYIQRPLSTTPKFSLKKFCKVYKKKGWVSGLLEINQLETEEKVIPNSLPWRFFRNSLTLLNKS